MKIQLMVVGVAHETWFKGQRDERQVTQLLCVDADPFLGSIMGQMLTYTPTAEEAKDLDLEKLNGRKLAFGVTEFRPGQGGKLNVRGKLDRSGLPKECLAAGPSSPAQAALRA